MGCAPLCVACAMPAIHFGYGDTGLVLAFNGEEVPEGRLRLHRVGGSTFNHAVDWDLDQRWAQIEALLQGDPWYPGDMSKYPLWNPWRDAVHAEHLGLVREVVYLDEKSCEVAHGS